MRQSLSARRRRSRPGWEYGVYFAVIFLFALPLSLARSVLAMGGSRSLVAEGGAQTSSFVGRAWSEARTVTGMIFSA